MEISIPRKDSLYIETMLRVPLGPTNIWKLLCCKLLANVCNAQHTSYRWLHINDLQKRRNSIPLSAELHLFCIKPSICILQIYTPLSPIYFLLLTLLWIDDVQCCVMLSLMINRICEVIVTLLCHAMLCWSFIPLGIIHLFCYDFFYDNYVSWLFSSLFTGECWTLAKKIVTQSEEMR